MTEFRSNFEGSMKWHEATVEDMSDGNNCSRFRPFFGTYTWETADSRMDDINNPIVPRDTYYCGVLTVNRLKNADFRDGSFEYDCFQDNCELVCEQLLLKNNGIKKCSCSNRGTLFTDAKIPFFYNSPKSK